MIKLSKNGKRLGRPPKSDESNGKVFLVNEVPVQKSFTIESDNIEKNKIEYSEIECSLMKIPQYSHDPSGPTKYGRYSTSPPSIKELGAKQWVVLAYIKADFRKQLILRKGNLEILQGCLNYLNKQTSPNYGFLTLVSKDIKLIEKNGEEVAVVELATKERKNENFWGEGERM